MIAQYDRIGETIYSHTLSCGLRVFYIPKPGFSRTFAMLATNFGSADASFTRADRTTVQPAHGIAHFLEHKMFECADGNALQKFAAGGASPNAFTSHNMTAYHFSCTDHFNDHLALLLDFVFTPYFTDENVAKEKGIIGQEIRMMEDDPFWQAFTGMYEGLYHNHPVRISIAGSEDSIAPITPADLMECFRAFYTPHNMVLAVCGSADFDTILSIAEQHTPHTVSPVLSRDYGKRIDTVCRPETIRHMAVSQPVFRIGIKDQPLFSGESWLRRQLIGEICCRILAGETSALHTTLYREGLISRKISSGYSLHPEAACASFACEGADPRAVRDRLWEALTQCSAHGVDAALFKRIKRASYGITLRVLDQPGDVCRTQCESAFHGEDFAAFADTFDTISAADIEQRLRYWAADDRMTLSMILPPETKRA